MTRPTSDWLPPIVFVIGLCLLLTAADSDMPWLALPALLVMKIGWVRLPEYQGGE